jgi:ribonuclease BN (tRNA processing enzyme)
MRLTVIGCSGSFAGPESAASSYLVETEQDGRTWRVLVDLGSGALGPLQRYVDPLALDAVLLSHLHPDHYFDLSGLYVMWKYHPGGPGRRIPVWGPTGVAEQAARAYGLPPEPGMTQEFEFHEYPAAEPGSDDGPPFRIGPFTVHHTRVAHPVPAYAFRLDADGRTLAYSGDTGPSPRLEEIAKGADLLLAEAAFQDGQDNPPHLHLTGSEAAEAAVAADVRRLVLTHIPPWHDPQVALAEAKAVFAGPVELAAPGATYDI